MTWKKDMKGLVNGMIDAGVIGLSGWSPRDFHQRVLGVVGTVANASEFFYFQLNSSTYHFTTDHSLFLAIFSLLDWTMLQVSNQYHGMLVYG